jgi:hypothetical protein
VVEGLSLASLSSLPRWVTWRNEMRGDPPKLTKVPYNPRRPRSKAKTNDPATWDTRDKATAAMPFVVSDLGGGVGIELGDMEDGNALGGVDLDSCREVDGTLQPWAVNVIERFGSYTEVSPSATGVKLLFTYSTSTVGIAKAAMGGQLGKSWKRGNGSAHPPAIELYLGGRYFTVTDAPLPGVSANIVPAPTELLLDLIMSIGPGFADTGMTNRASVKGRSEKALARGGALKRLGFDYEQMVLGLLADDDPEIVAWAREKGVPQGGRGFRRIWEKLQADEPAATTDAEAEVARLAKLPLLLYAQQRTIASKTLGFTSAWLDKLVASERGDRKDTQGEALVFSDAAKWPGPVDGFELICDIRDLLHLHIVLPPGGGWAAALWCLHTFLLGISEHTPRLAVISPERGCGKSTLLDLLGRLVYRPLLAANVTSAATFRVIARHRPTLMIDEADTFLRDNDELRGVLNAGHRYDGYVVRTVGEDMEPRKFSVFAAVAIALIGNLPGTLSDRSIHLRMRRAGRGETVQPIRRASHEAAAVIVRKAHTWAEDHRDRLTGIEPNLPPAMWNRTADNWRSLFAIADEIGGILPAKLAEAAALLLAQGSADPQSLGVMLLEDIRLLFRSATTTDRMASATIVHALIAMEERPWAAFGKASKPLTQVRMADILRQFSITSGTVRDGSETFKGYTLKQFEDPWERYLEA